MAARPNFMKVGPLYHALAGEDWAQPRLVHTGQHYDRNMSDVFLRDLAIPDPDVHLGIGSGSHAEQTGRTMVAYEDLIRNDPPDWTVVAGDVNATLACSVAAKKCLIPVAHLEAGLRSGDRTMPEEINRIVTDAIADLHWTPSEDASDNLRREGVAEDCIDLVGNIMIDALERLRPSIEGAQTAKELGLAGTRYGVVTLHRPSNVDQEAQLRRVLEALEKAGRNIPLVFPVHPRTRARMQELGLPSLSGIRTIDPLPYIEFMNLVFGAAAVITDSGGLQEETTYLGIPCITLRTTTERPITISQGTNRLVGAEDLDATLANALAGPLERHAPPPLWDGQTAPRVVHSLKQRVERRPL